MSLDVIVASASDLPNLESLGKIDPYVSVEYQGITKKTQVIKGELNPVWNETLVFDLKGQPVREQDELKIFVKDWERVGRNRLVGKCTVSMSNLLRSAGAQINLALNDANQRPLGAQLSLSVIYKPPPGAEAGFQDGGATVPGADEQAAGQGDEVDAAAAEEAAISPTQAGTQSAVARRRRIARTAIQKPRGPLSTKPQDMQLRVRVVEGRQLQGNNVSPVCRVSVRRQVKQTDVCPSTNSPVWNKSFVFTFNVSVAEIVDDILLFEVFNSRKLRSDALIGSFKCDVGLIYDEQRHCLLNKWILLSIPDDKLAGATGYVKISAALLGPGDDVPSFKSEVAHSDEEDIESNLLRPAGIQLQPATFSLKVYYAEDLPRMDSDFLQGIKKVFGSDEKKEFVDPYFIAGFAGTKVFSKILYNCDHPHWNQELRIGLHFPSMCEKIKLQLMDWDRITKHDHIATSYVDIGNTSRPGSDESEEDGFLPTFGPCFVNFYGAPREYSELPAEYVDLNKGRGEGVAYRGRVLLELQTVIGERPSQLVQDILHEDILRVQKYLRRRQFCLHTAFINATMVSEIDAPVEFEVSIGNYGNKLDDQLPPSVSTTQPTNAVFDGCYYYFLPWDDSKPCVTVDCQWEDVTFRLEAVNLLLTFVDKLNNNIEKVRIAQQANLPKEELAQLVMTVIDQLIADCRKPLPKPMSSVHVENELDRHVCSSRQVELANITAEAAQLRDTETSIDKALTKLQRFATTLNNLAVEPQNSIPDVFIWMISAGERIAYYRCPANSVLWSSNPECRGKFAGKLETVQLKYPGDKAEKENISTIPALLRLKIWLGLEQYESDWHKMQTEGTLSVYAETYENQISILGNWTNKGPALTRPKWSDATGKVELNKDDFQLPPGWRWDTDWYISPELSMLFDKDAGRSTFMEDVYECQSRLPGTNWTPASVPWTDVKGDAATAKDDLELPSGWEWKEDWQVDLNRAVDENGWEYSVEATLGGYGPVEKAYHLCRRRRLVRLRQLVKPSQAKVDSEAKVRKAAESEGWEYAPLFTMKFHFKERRVDLVRRRRWHRKMVAVTEDVTAASKCVFQIASKKDKDKDSDDSVSPVTTTPRMFLVCGKPYRYQLRAYIYQGRDLLSGDSSGLSDPFTRVVFLNHSQATENLRKTICPTWDQTLVFDTVEIHGDPQSVADNPPKIIVEIFDYDSFGDSEFLGRTEAVPIVKLDTEKTRPAVLHWLPVTKRASPRGELLAAFELFLTEGKAPPVLPPKRGQLMMVPNGVRPQLQRTAIEVVCWGIRSMRKFQLSNVVSPNVEIEVGGQIVRSKVIKNAARNPNFDEPTLFFDILLPLEELYAPPINICVRDNRQFGRKPIVGVHVVKSLQRYRRQPAVVTAELDTDKPSATDVGDSKEAASDHVIDMIPARSKAPSSVSVHMVTDEGIDWWSKYYASIGNMDKCWHYVELGYDKLQVYETELEKVPEFKKFRDFCQPFKLSRGKNADEIETSIAGEFKGNFFLYTLPDDPAAPLPPKMIQSLPPCGPVECVVRVYIIRAFDLQPHDPGGSADPYVQVRLGTTKLDTSDEYVPNTLNPVFGKMFELKACFPLSKDLRIRIKDYDLLSANDVMGETTIDLENRYLSQFGASVGLPQTYCSSGVCQWRDSRRPTQLLDEFCRKHLGTPPVYPSSTTVNIGQRVYKLADFEQMRPAHSHLGSADERLALYILNSLPKSIGIPFVPEHIETRRLFNRLMPGLEQGKLLMWVDMFPAPLGPPGPVVEITPRQAKKYELRVIIWNTKDVILEETSITGERMSDIYVKGWMSGMYDDRQKTDVHYRSLGGEGNFNWRFIFPFDYLPEEQTVIIMKKEHFWSLDKTETKRPPVLVIQIWDNDKFSADDFLGSLELDLTSLPMPAKRSRACKVEMLPTASKLSASGGRADVKKVSLFEQKRLRGFWPCVSESAGQHTLAGKLEMEIELVTEDEALDRPAGRARDDPNQNPTLDPPNRPETSFLWFTSPWKTFKFIVWRRFKVYFFIGLIILVVVLFIALFVYAVPGAMVDKMFNP